jgi:hypothetical protein
MLGVEANESELHERLTAIVRATPPLMQVLSGARHLCLPDWFLFSGAVYQPVLNHLIGRPLDYGIKDYDLGYFDGSDLSYEAEDVVIRRVKATFDEPLRSMLPSVSPICLRCVYGPIPAARRSASPGLLRMCDAAGLKSSLRTSHRSGTRDDASKSLPTAL